MYPWRYEVKNLIFFVCFCTAVTAAVDQTAFATPQDNYKTYTNARFKYSISYPADLLIPQGEAENGDGQVFREKSSSSVEMRVYGGHNVLNETLRSRYAELIRKWSNGLTYKVIRRDWFVVSAMVNGKIHYQKTILRGNVFKTFEIEYDAVRGSTYNDVTDRIARSFKG
jgi:hypothetical protein